MKAVRISSLALAAVFGLVTGAQAQFIESEPNDTKAAANNVFGIASAGTIRGNTTGTSTTVPGAASADNFLVKTTAAGLGIYQYRMTLTTTGTAGHVGSLRGLTQTAGVPNVGTDSTLQTSSTATTPARFNQWYGFGKEEQLYYRVTGTATTTSDYTATLSRTSVTAVNLGVFNPGTITITTIGRGHTIDTDLWIYDGNFNAIAGYGSDDTIAANNGGTSSVQSYLSRTYAAGTYYMAMSNFNLANNQGSPVDDNYRSGALTDFANVVLNSSTTTNTNMAFAINGTQFAAAKPGAYDVYWGKFVVVPEPASMFALATGIAALASRRRRKNK